MPLNAKGTEIMDNMVKQYGPEHGKSVFYASKASGRITGVDDDGDMPDPSLDHGALASGVTGGIAGEDCGEGQHCEEDGNLMEKVEAAKDAGGTPAAAAAPGCDTVAPDDFGGLQQGTSFVPEVMQRINQMTQSLHQLAQRVSQIAAKR